MTRTEAEPKTSDETSDVTTATANGAPGNGVAGKEEVAGRPYALLRAGFPYLTTLGMRRVTTYCMDIAIGDAGRLYVLCREDGQGGTIRRINWEDEDLGTIGSGGQKDGQLMWPVQLLRDRQENLFVSDEGLHRISLFAPDGTFLGKWGEHGQDVGQLDRPSGIAFDAAENVYVADTMNHRVQHFTRDGRFLDAFGSHGSEAGQLDLPWGVAVDGEGNVLVADWRNDRIQSFSPDGRFRFQFGRSGSAPGELKGPAGIAVDAEGDVYVADRGNHRVQQFDHSGRFVEEFLGDATLSRIGRTYILANPKVLRGREMTALGPSKRLRGPAAVRLDDEGRMYIPDFGSHRIQVYRKETYRLTPEEIWPEQKSPFLYNV